MARIRSIKPSFFKSDDVSALPLRARLTWIGLWTQCDDQGRTKDHVKLIKADVWPLDPVSLADIEEDLTTLARHGRIVRYEVGGERYLAITNWDRHQKINRASASHIPPPPAGLAPAGHCAPEPRETGSYPQVSPHGALTEGSRGEGKGKEGKGGERAGARDTPAASTVPAFVPPQNPDKIEPTDRPSGPSRAMRLGAEGDPVAGSVPAGNTHADRPEPREATPPPDRCVRHVDDPEPPPCGACGDARRRRERWEIAEAERRRNAPQCRRHRGQPAHNCAPCRAERLAGGTE